MSAVIEAKAPVAPVAPAPGDVPIPEVSSIPAGAQAVRPAPPGTIPGPLKAFSDSPNSAKTKMLERLKARSTTQPDPSKPVEAAKPEAKVADAPKTPETPKTETPSDEDLLDEASVNSPEDKPVEEAPKEGEVKPQTPEVKQKVNPWNLVKEHKTRAETLEKEIADLKKLVPNTEARKAEIAEMEAVKQRAKELEEHIRFVDYQASDEYKQKYEKPYESQWVKSMKELKGVTVADDSGESRAIEPNDLLQLVNMPLAKARQVANENFGDYADDVMQHRAEIRRLYDARVEALESAKKEGMQRGETFQKMTQEKMELLNTEVRTVYEKAVESFASKPEMAEFFKPIDGDEEANARLEKGYEMVDRAFKMNPMDPSLTPEQRASIVKLHAAVRHRSAAFGRAKHLLAKERADHAATKKRLAQYEQTVPNRGGVQPATVSISSGSAMAQMQARLAARAKR